jgi:hypothetical protein
MKHPQQHNPESHSSRTREQVPPEVPIGGTALEKATGYLRIAFAEADARDGVITPDDAEVIAALLAPQLPPGSAMGRIADIGDIDPAALARECQTLNERTWKTPDIALWITRLEQYLATPTEPAPGAGRGLQPDIIKQPEQ